MITMDELLKGAKYDSQSKEVRNNLSELLYKINIVRIEYSKPLTVTSGLRTEADQLRIYAAKGITDKSKIPMSSMHLTGGAVDLSDSDQKLQQFILDNLDILDIADLYCENFLYTKNWVHMQVKPFKSYKVGGSRFFTP